MSKPNSTKYQEEVGLTTLFFRPIFFYPNIFLPKKIRPIFFLQKKFPTNFFHKKNSDPFCTKTFLGQFDQNKCLPKFQKITKKILEVKMKNKINLYQQNNLIYFTRDGFDIIVINLVTQWIKIHTWKLFRTGVSLTL